MSNVRSRQLTGIIIAIAACALCNLVVVRYIKLCWPFPSWPFVGLERLGSLLQDAAFGFSLLLCASSFGFGLGLSGECPFKPQKRHLIAVSAFMGAIFYLLAQRWSQPAALGNAFVIAKPVMASLMAADWRRIILTAAGVILIIILSVLIIAGIRRPRPAWKNQKATWLFNPARHFKGQRCSNRRIVVLGGILFCYFSLMILGLPIVGAPFFDQSGYTFYDVFKFQVRGFDSILSPFFFLSQPPIQWLFGNTLIGRQLITCVMVTFSALFLQAGLTYLWGWSFALGSTLFFVTHGRVIHATILGNLLASQFLPLSIAIYLGAKLLYLGRQSLPRPLPQATTWRRAINAVSIGGLIVTLPYYYRVVWLTMAPIGVLLVVLFLTTAHRIGRTRDWRFWTASVIAIMVPAVFFLFVYDFNVDRLWREVTESNGLPTIGHYTKLDHKPEGLEATPDLLQIDCPVWVGCSPPEPTPAFPVCVYWNFNLSDSLRLIRHHLNNCWRYSANNFPGSSYDEILMVSGLFIMFLYFNPSTLCFVVALLFFSLLPYVLIADPAAFRRGYQAYLLLSPVAVVALAPLFVFLHQAATVLTNERIARRLLTLFAATLIIGRVGVEYVCLTKAEIHFDSMPACHAYQYPVIARSWSNSVHGKTAIFWNCDTPDAMKAEKRKWFKNCFPMIIETNEFKQLFPHAEIMTTMDTRIVLKRLTQLAQEEVMIIDCNTNGMQTASIDQVCQFVRQRSEIYESKPGRILPNETWCCNKFLLVSLK